ncbi:MAG: hypothetical protein H7A33_08350 [Deltaproteobacteria bacterium]|nr:hypothetical protein [Deltaproteobacteria bacterium]
MQEADLIRVFVDPLHAWGMNHKQQIEIENDFSVWLAPKEYVIIRKLEYYREGGSGKHLSDIASILENNSESVNQGFLDEEIRKRGLSVEWKKVTSS